MDCFWNNQPRHDIRQQLIDGIRAFDLDTCQVDNRVVLCHGYGKTRALGDELDIALAAFRDFFFSNPRDVVTLTFGEYDGDPAVARSYILARLNAYFPNQILERGTARDGGFPTLRQMAREDKRLVVFFGIIIEAMPVAQRPLWARLERDYYLGSWSYTNSEHDAQGILRKLEEFCDHPDPKYAQLWQTLDYEYSPNFESVVREILQHQHLGLCISELADDVNRKILPIAAEYCTPKQKFIHRVNVDMYWKGTLMQVVDRVNQYNIERAKGSAL